MCGRDSKTRRFKPQTQRLFRGTRLLPPVHLPEICPSVSLAFLIFDAGKSGYLTLPIPKVSPGNWFRLTPGLGGGVDTQLCTVLISAAPSVSQSRSGISGSYSFRRKEENGETGVSIDCMVGGMLREGLRYYFCLF